jgi:hypothetical protein
MPASLSRPSTPIPPSAEHGFVKSAPGSSTEPMTVAIPSFGEDHVFQIRYWMPRGATLPSLGDRVLVLVDDVSEPWVIAWWPE